MMKLTLAHNHSLPSGSLGLAITADGNRAFVSCADGALYSLDLASGQAEAFEEKHQSYANGCVLLPDGRTVISSGYDGLLLWHDVETRRSVRRVQAHKFWNWQLALSPDGNRLAATTGQYLPGGWKYEPAPETEASVKIFDTRSGEIVARFAHTPPVLSCAFSNDGKHLAAANLMGEVRVWEIDGRSEDKLLAHWTSPDFTSWGSIKTHHYCGGIYSLAFSPDDASLIGCGMGPMTDPMAGNGKMTWQRWNWRKGERIDQIKEGQRGSGLMEALAWHPEGKIFVMAGRQAQGTWNAALFSASDGSLLQSIDTKKRITQARFTKAGQSLVLSGAIGQPQRKAGVWPPWGKLQIYDITV
jgi:WD40 repeat protein